jgi:hypothetical protein
LPSRAAELLSGAKIDEIALIQAELVFKFEADRCGMACVGVLSPREWRAD